MKTVSILYICTGQYSVFWPEFYESIEQYFCPDCKKEYFVFTDSPSLPYAETNPRVHIFPQEAMPWPYPTLLRFSMFLRAEKELANFDYIFFFNANAKVLQLITEEMILPRDGLGEKLVVAKHATYNWSVYDNPFDRNPRCHAYIPYGLGKLYVQACLIGGTAKAFLRMSRKLARQIDKDLEKNVIALWHDESYVNRYILFRKDYRLLGREYVRQKIVNGQENLILMRPKSDYFDVDGLKAEAPKTEFTGWAKRYNDFCQYIVKKYLYYRDVIRDKRKQRG